MSEDLSWCCDAPINDFGFCTDCKEHAEPEKDIDTTKHKEEEWLQLKLSTVHIVTDLFTSRGWDYTELPKLLRELADEFQKNQGVS